MLKRLQRRIVLITMTLVGLVLLIVLAASTITNVQAERNRIDQALTMAVNQGPGAGFRPSVGGPNGGGGGEFPDAEASREDIAADNRAFTPVYVMRVDLFTGLILADNSDFVTMAPELVNATLDQIEHYLDALGESPTTSALSVNGQLEGSSLVYLAQLKTDGILTIALADTSPISALALRQSLISLAIWVGAMLVLLIISLLLARIVTRPISEAWEQQRRFVADASHELKTPLTVILANTSLLAAHPEQSIAEQHQWVESTQLEAQRMDGLIRDLLLLAQTDEDSDAKANLSPSKRRMLAALARDDTRELVDFGALIEHSLLQYEAVFYERGITLTSTLAADVQLISDSAQLQRLVHILLDNASKYAADQATVELIGAPDDSHHALFKVWNDGQPISPDALPHIFERFYRGDEAHSDSEGYGLGLSLAQAIAQAQGGEITAQSTAEDGTTFTVQL